MLTRKNNKAIFIKAVTRRGSAKKCCKNHSKTPALKLKDMTGTLLKRKSNAGVFL